MKSSMVVLAIYCHPRPPPQRYKSDQYNSLGYTSITSQKVVESSKFLFCFPFPRILLTCQTTQPMGLVFPSEQVAWVKEELQSLLKKGAVVSVTDCHKGFHSNIYLVVLSGISNLKLVQFFKLVLQYDYSTMIPGNLAITMQ